VTLPVTPTPMQQTCSKMFAICSKPLRSLDTTRS
jgi:hypothetical protein